MYYPRREKKGNFFPQMPRENVSKTPGKKVLMRGGAAITMRTGPFSCGTAIPSEHTRSKIRTAKSGGRGRTMLLPQRMKASDFTCLLCGSRLGLTLAKLIIGDNPGTCPMCAEPFMINVTEDEMNELVEAENPGKKRV